MEPEGSLPHSQELSTCPYPEPDKSSPHHPILSLQDPSYYYPPTYALVFVVVSFPLAFPPITYTSCSSSPSTLHAPSNCSMITSTPALRSFRSARAPYGPSSVEHHSNILTRTGVASGLHSEGAFVVLLSSRGPPACRLPTHIKAASGKRRLTLSVRQQERPSTMPPRTLATEVISGVI
jgi:hypothetical protein